MDTAISVTSSRTAVLPLPGEPTEDTRTVFLQNLSTSAVFVGGSAVTTTNGIQILQNESLVIPNVPYTTRLFAITWTNGTSDLRVLLL